MGARIRSIFAFMTRLPVPIREGDFDALPKTAPLFPVVGAVIGLGLYSVYEFLSLAEIHSPILQMVAVLVVYYLICGGIHLDGVADVWDGMNCGGSRDKVFQAMSDSCIGTFGAVGLIFIVAIAGLSAYMANGLELFFAPIVGRSLALLLISIYPSAKSNGLGKPMIDNCNKKTVLLASAILLGVAWILPQAIWAYLALILLYVLKLRPFLLRLEGVTGDLIGFTIEMSQWLFLLTLQGGHLF